MTLTYFNKILFAAVGCSLLTGISVFPVSDNWLSNQRNIVVGDTSLKKLFEKDFLIGTALNSAQINQEDKLEITLLGKHFNAITAENVMKSALIHPSPGVYNFTLPDKMVALGKKHGMYLVGHTLIWHSQLSPFAATMKNKDLLLRFMEDHISTVAGRYKSDISSWDVVNEAFEENGEFRKSVFFELLGESYIKTAFDLAKKASPNSKLYYNDYNIEQPQKRAGVIAMIKKLQASGTKIDGVGIQGHWSVNKLPLKEIEEAIIEYSKLGLEVSFTELDLTVLPNPWDLQGADVSSNYANSPSMNPYPNSLPDSMQVKLANAYESLFKLFLKHNDKIERITFWGLNDKQSWLNGWPIRGRTNYPLLFDRNNKTKLAFTKVAALRN